MKLGICVCISLKFYNTLEMSRKCFTFILQFIKATAHLIARGEFRPRQTRQLPRVVDLKERLLSSQSY